MIHYYKGIGYIDNVVDKRIWSKDNYTQAALERADNLFKEACKIPTDKNLAASMHYKLKHFKTIATEYADTETGKFVRGQCDTYKDYNIMDTNKWDNWYSY